MSRMKRYLEDISEGMGFAGEITDEVIAEADQRISVDDPTPEAWACCSDLLGMAALALLNRRDCCGGYVGPRPTTHKDEYSSWVPMPQALEQHFSGGRIIGLHTTSTANTSRWMAFDIDAHNGESERDTLAVAEQVSARVRQAGLRPFVFSSDDRGGIHVWVVFPQPRPTAEVYDLAHDIAEDLPVEAFPKQPEVEPGRFGNWIRLPGKHPKRGCYSCIRLGDRWGSVDETIAALLEMTAQAQDHKAQ